MMPNTKKIGMQQRDVVLERVVDEKQKIIEVSFASSQAYERWWGWESLVMEGMDTSRSDDGVMPFLVNHWRDDQVGNVEKTWIDGDVGRAHIKFGNSVRANEIWDDMTVSKIRRGISLGYIIDEMILTGKTGDTENYDITKSTVLEISTASIPADTTVGTEKGMDILSRCKDHETKILTKIKEAIMPQEKPELKIDHALLAKEIAKLTPAPAAPAAPAATKQDDADFETKAAALVVEDRAGNVKRMTEIQALGAAHRCTDLATEHIVKGTGLETFRGILLEKVANAKPVEVPDASIGMAGKDLKKYSLLKAITAAASGDWSDAGLEKECSDAVGTTLKRTAKGFFLPLDVMAEQRGFAGAEEVAKREMNVGVAAEGGNIVATDLMMGSFIELLRNAMMIRRLGATVLSGLVGDIAIPKQTGGATGYWLAEGGDATLSEQTFGQVGMTPKTVAGRTQYTRKLMQQTSLDVENFVRLDLAIVLALAMDLAAITADGTGNTPTGVLATSGIGLVAMGTDGLAPTYQSAVDLETAISVANADIGSMAYLTNSKVRGKMKTTALETGYPVYMWGKGAERGFGEVNGYPAAVSNQVPWNLDKGTSSGVCSATLFGVWSQLLIGLWGGLDILVDPYTNSASGGMQIVAFQDCDIAVRHAEAFAVIKDYLTV